MAFLGWLAGWKLTTARLNAISGIWTPYAAAWTGAGTPSVGNGTLAAEYALNGGECTVRLGLQWGSTTTGGTGAWSFSLPFTAAALTNSVMAWTGSAIATDNGNAYYAGACRVFSGASTVMCLSGVTSTGSTPGEWFPTRPFTWANGDYLNLEITYQPA